MPPFSFQKLRVELGRFNIKLFEQLDIQSRLEKPLYRILGGFSRKPDKM
jgi:hypothetical protein